MNWRIILLALVILATEGCTATDSHYFGSPDPMHVRGPSRVGQQALLGVGDLTAHEGDTVELVNAVAVGASEGSTAAYALPLDATGGGGIGGVGGDTFGDGLSFAKLAHGIKGYAFGPQDGDIEIVMRVVMNTPGTVAFSAVDLSFRVNGGDVMMQELPTQGKVCFDDPTPTTC